MTKHQSTISNPLSSIQAGRLQAWCINLLSIVADAYHIGAVIGKGGSVRAGTQTLTPDVMMVAVVGHGEIGAPALAVDLISVALSERQRADRLQAYADAGVHEYWQIAIETAQPAFYQLNLQGHFDLIAPDRSGIYFSLHEELFFPVSWLRNQPDLWAMMQYWDMIQDLPNG